jgi:hypothetical protein
VGLLVLMGKATGFQGRMLQVLPVTQDVAEAVELAMPNKENAFSTLSLLHLGHSMTLVDELPSTSFSNLLPQD